MSEFLEDAAVLLLQGIGAVAIMLVGVAVCFGLFAGGLIAKDRWQAKRRRR